MQGVTLSQIHPVLDGKNRPIPEPSCFEINASIQRALVKAIALHGLGLYIYAGEDLPDVEKDSEPPKPKAPVSTLPTASAASAAQIRYIERLSEETGSDTSRLLDFFGVASLDELSSQAASRAIRTLEQKRRAA